MKRLLKVGDFVELTGCFTEEYFIRGMAAHEIVQELGLPARFKLKRMYVAMAIHLPGIHDFELGGWAKFSTDKFFNYDKSTKKGRWSKVKFEEVYRNKRMPLSVDAAKQAWRDGMNSEKLIKVLFNTPKSDRDRYPEGGRASQIIVTRPVKCLITTTLLPTHRFTGVW